MPHTPGGPIAFQPKTVNASHRLPNLVCVLVAMCGNRNAAQQPHLQACASTQGGCQVLCLEGGIQQKQVVLKAICTAALLQPRLLLAFPLRCWFKPLDADDGA